MGWCPDSFCTWVSPCRIPISPSKLDGRNERNLILMFRPIRWLDHCQASLPKFRIAYTYSISSCHDCKTRPTRNSSKPSKSTHPTLYKEVNTHYRISTISTDCVGLDEEQAAEVVKEVISWKMVDLLEISGGNYSSPAFCDLEHTSTSPRQALFSSFTTSLLPSLPSPPEGPAIMLTGGLHSRALIASSLRERACDLVGIGRPACLNPTLPCDIILNQDLPEEKTDVGRYDIPGGPLWKRILGGGGSSRSSSNKVQPATYTEDDTTPLVQDTEPKSSSTSGIPLVGAGISTFWHEWQLCRIGRGVEPDPTMAWGRGLAIEALWWGIAKGGPLGWYKAYKGL
jgi:hypothetical protein